MFMTHHFATLKKVGGGTSFSTNFGLEKIVEKA
jgi:hypothetical protein